MRVAMVLAAALALAFVSPVLADEEPRTVRLIGEAPGAKDPVPSRFVIDARLTPGDGDFQSKLEGWFAGLGDVTAHSSIEGSCVEKRCTLSVSVVNGTLSLVGDLGEAGPVTARYSLKPDYGDVPPPQLGSATLKPIVGAAPGLGALAEPGAIDEAELGALLMWNHANTGFGSDSKGDPPSSFQRDSLADWQEAQGRTPTGLIFVSDLAALRAAAKAEQEKSRWTVLGDPAKGWSAGYPAALLPTRAGVAYVSADGKARLEIAVDPPMTDEAWDKHVEMLTADRDTITGRNYTRVNSDMELRWAEKGVITVAAYHNRENGLARMVLTYPESAEETWQPWESILQRGLVVTDELKR